MKNTQNDDNNIIYVYLSVADSFAICLNWIRNQNYGKNTHTHTHRLEGVYVLMITEKSKKMKMKKNKRKTTNKFNKLQNVNESFSLACQSMPHQFQSISLVRKYFSWKTKKTFYTINASK